MHANLSSTVDFAAGTVHISTTSAQYLDSSLGWIADSNLNLSGTAAIGGDGNFSGSVTFNNSSTGTLFGSFYGGASVENMGGLIQKDDKSLKASFGAVKQ